MQSCYSCLRVLQPSSDSLRPARRVARRVPTAILALVVSLAAHAVAAVTAGVALPYALRGEGQEVEIEVDLARTDQAGPEEERPPPPASAPPSPAPSADARHRLAHPRMAMAVPPKPSHDLPSAGAPAASAPPASLEEREPLARFSLPLGTLRTQTPASGAVTGAAQFAAGPFGGSADSGDVVDEKNAAVPARLLSSSPLSYPPEARRAEVEGDVNLQILVDTDGRVVEARGLNRHGYGLDEAAVRAMRGYRFSPALRDGHAVRVRMRWTVQFRLR